MLFQLNGSRNSYIYKKIVSNKNENFQYISWFILLELNTIHVPYALYLHHSTVCTQFGFGFLKCWSFVHTGFNWH